MKVFVALKTDMYDRSNIIGVFATIEVAKTISEAEEPGRRFDWDDKFGEWAVFPFSSGGPAYQYSIEEHEVRDA
jgi:hypothetical protein